MAVHTDEVIRNYLKQNQGSTIQTMSHDLGMGESRIRAVINSMIDAYISHYTATGAAAYRVAEIPADAVWEPKK